MKNILNVFSLIIICIIAVSCSTNYYTVLLSEDAKVYNSSDSTNVITIIPKDTPVYLSSKSNKKNYKKIKWGNYSGWTYNPIYTSYTNYTPLKSSPSSSYNYNSSSSSSGGSVKVKGYTRKDGTYVRPHTRSSPSRRR
ncbi:hypothetical protein [Chryseobacterium sp. ISL-6]|uniref:hypothetical protein n=1 Tax=Chryseobacterium sp. ISL-6 TaxID=2819143 RepID=UPI001BE5D010|nr:hypothetical protein [Chryseobacterium sp. ISL-6]MBT2621202.1 hypothetical protein [Chryseobacterium sp. ISL-6]